MTSPKPASDATTRANAAVLKELPFGDDTDFENARRGLIAAGSGQIENAEGRVVWDIDQWSFLDGDALDTVNPSLWRQGRLVSIAGLFEVTDGVYQVRNFDLSVTSFLRTDSGWIVVDPLLSVEPMQAAHGLVKEHLEDLPVVAVIHTHSHIDHYGGVRAVVSEDDLAAGRVKIIAPEGFLEESVSENVLLGNVMSRRASYMYGNLVGWDAQRGVGAGLGQLTSTGTVTLIPPTDIVSETGQEMTIDGLRIVFQHTPGAEAPAELCFYLPERKALCMAEIATHTLHNVYALRGAKIRDARIWSQHIADAIRLFGDDAEVDGSERSCWPPTLPGSMCQSTSMAPPPRAPPSTRSRRQSTRVTPTPATRCSTTTMRIRMISSASSILVSASIRLHSSGPTGATPMSRRAGYWARNGSEPPICPTRAPSTPA